MTKEWSPSPVAGGALAVGGVFLLVAAVFTSSDPAGMVLLGIAGLLLAGFAAHALLIRPRLALAGGQPPTITIRTLTGRHTFTPDQIDRIRVLSFRRIGRRVPQIEFDLLSEDALAARAPETTARETTVGPESGGPRDDTRLMVFGRWDLGQDPAGVAEELRSAGFPVEIRQG